MKTLNYIATICFGTVALGCIIIVFTTKQYYVFALSGICFVLAFVAWGDYKKARDEEDIYM